MAARRLRLVFAALLTAALAPALPLEASAATAIPTGFVLRDTDTGLGQYELTDFGYLPDNSIIAIGKSGTVRWLTETGAGRTIGTFTVRTNGDMGLVGLAIAPDFATSHQIYLNREINVSSGFVMRLSRVTVSLGADGNPAGLTGERTLFEVPGFYDVHGIDTVIAASDGTLWLSVGDAADFTKTDPGALRALDIDQPYGKIFHLDASGNGVPSNPYYDAANPGSARSKVFARGFRNPFRFGLDPNLGLPVAGEVGWNTYEELDVVQRGGNYGWPCWEATHATPGYSTLPGCAGVPNQPPIVEYSHGTGPMQGNSITGGIVYNGSSYPAAYRGSFFFGDYVGHKIWTVRYDSQGRLTQAPENPPQFTDIGGPVRFAAAQNGDIVYADILSGHLRRLSYSAGNKAPIANATSSTDPDTRTVSFDGNASVDYDGDPLTYSWDFGDGHTDTGPKVSHPYGPGTTFTAKLTVTDPLGANGSTTLTVAPGNHSPQLTLTTPGDAATFSVGQQVNLSATATDIEDGTLPVTWTSAVRHCPTEATCHEHPGLGATGTSFGMPFTEHPDSRMEFTATVTDSAGVSASRTYVAMPRQHRITLVSSQPAALSIPVEGGVNTALVTEGASFDVDAAALGTDGFSKFNSWQGGPASTSWTITVGTGDLTLTANYDTPIDQRYNTDAAARAKLGAPTAAEVIDGTVRYRTYAGGRMYWSAATGAKFVTDPVLAKYLALGGHQVYGPPTTDTSQTADGVGQFTHFQNWASIFYTANTGAHLVKGRIRDKYQALGWERSVLGYPTNDEDGTPDGVGRFNHFSKGGSIYWTPSTDAHAVYGLIRQKWAATGWERGPLGYPLNDEDGTPDGIGRFNHFSKGGSIYYTPSTGAHWVNGAIKARWAALGWERSYLRYPISDEYTIPNGWRSDFQGGYVYYTYATGTVDRRW